MSPRSHIPGALPQICAPREELMGIFSQCEQKPYIYVQAPAGYGKTVAALLWLQKNRRVFEWLALDHFDNLLSLFYRSLCRALLSSAQKSWAEQPARRTAPRFDVMMQLLSSPAFAASPIENAVEFISMLSWRKGQYTLVLDDLHNITNEEIIKSLPYVLKRLPPFITVLLLSRTPLPEGMHSLTEHEQTCYVSGAEFSLSPAEIRQYFASCGWVISPEKAAEIHAYTDGWMIMLNAMLFSDSHELSPENYKLQLEEYFEKNIWGSYDQPTKDFLMKTSILDSFDLELGQLLTENDNCAEVLEQLLRSKINLSRMDDEYRYHDLFLLFLRERLDKSGLDRALLFETATRYYLESQQFYQAADCSMRTGNAQLRLQVIQAFFQSKNTALEQFLELSGLYDLKKIPRERLNRHPVLFMPNILAAFYRGETEATGKLFDLLYAALPTYIKSAHPILGVIATRLLQDFRLKLADLVPFMTSLGISCTPVPGQAPVVTVQMPLLHRSVRDFYEFCEAGVQEAVRGVFSCVLAGDYPCFYHSVAAGLRMEQNRLPEALAEALKAQSNLGPEASNEVCFGVSVGLAEIYFLTREEERAQAVLAQTHQFIESRKAMHLLKNLLAYETRQKLLDGDKEAAQAWLAHYFVSEGSFTEFYKIYRHFTTTRAYIVLSKTGAALTALGQLEKLAAAMRRPLDQAEAGVLTALVEWLTGKRNEARDRLREVLAQMQPYGFIRIIANEGKAALPILAAVLRQLNKETNQNKDLYRFTKEVQLAAYDQAKRYRGLTQGAERTAVKLSPRQTEVLNLLAKGYKNAEIVNLTGLSINTIKEHTRVAYRKLEANNALEAISKAKRLGLLT